eukprot:CAMPEP_0195530992 /NCGR_PEP_ID=MMETSP0794_2-20130614/34106_1 /TAXON_ID=515487 /ORGANISM="Stephanopyxis turris, Strain CCMP 815" /LENGTH=469 /DNA_ID=CAMNT_0040662621 /DNA_START=128 /DNA_END=1537 /DNA_ORIENTATION=+
MSFDSDSSVSIIDIETNTYCTELSSAIRRSDWNSALFFVSSHPHLVSIQFPDGTTILHELCNPELKPPIDLVNAVIRACPGNITAFNFEGHTPVHLSVETGVNVQILRTLLKHHQQYLASFEPDVSSLALHFFTPAFYIFGREWSDFLESKEGERAIQEAQWVECVSELKGELKTLWDKAVLLLRATYQTYGRKYGSVCTDDEHAWHIAKIAHTALKIEGEIPLSFLKFVLSLCCSQDITKERDHKGRSLLATCGTNVSLGLEFVEAILEHSPEIANVADNEQRLPLHLSIERGRTWNAGVHMILMNAPQTLSIRDSKTHLYPFMLAAQGVHSDLDTCFLLLRENPLLAWGLAEDPPWLKTKKLKNELNELDCHAKDLQCIIGSLEAKIENLESSRKMLQRKAMDSLSKNVTIKLENDRLKVENDELKRKVAELFEKVTIPFENEMLSITKKRKIGNSSKSDSTYPHLE